MSSLDSSGSEDNAVKIAKMKAKKVKKSTRKSNSPSFDAFLNIDKKKTVGLSELEREQLIYEQLQESEVKKQR